MKKKSYTCTMKKIVIFALVLAQYAHCLAQIEGLTDETYYNIELNGVVSSGDNAPLWMSAGRYGLSATEPNSGYLRAGLWRSEETDSALNWRYGYGLDLAVPVNYTSKFVVHQAYGIVQYKNARLTLGAKEIPMEMLNNELSSGAMTISNNFRPIPQVRFELPDWWDWHFTGDWVRVKGHLAYGMTTDHNWQEDFVAEGEKYTRHALFHSKSGFLQVGRTDVFPVTFTLGLQMAAQFGGYGYNIQNRDDARTVLGEKTNLGNAPKDFWDAFIPGGNDVNDGDYNNVAGNQTGNWYMDLMYHGKGWNVKAYAQHFFEDHSQMFVQYGWKDMLWGLEANLPRNPLVSNVVAEYLRTDDQTGGVYHDENTLLPVQISGKDDYYNHHVYGAWQHWGQTMGNPLLLSPVYNTDGKLICYYNRVRAFHIGIDGDPLPSLHYRLKYSHLKTWGTYTYPTLDPTYQNYLLAEVTWKLGAKGSSRSSSGSSGSKWWDGFSFTGSWGLNTGDLLDQSNGFSFTIRKTGKLF